MATGRPALNARELVRWESRSMCKGGKILLDAKKGSDNAGARTHFSAAALEIPKGPDSDKPSGHRSSFTTTCPKPIDLDLDLGNRVMYWTDRGEPAARKHGESRVDGRGARKAQRAGKSSLTTSWKASACPLDLANNRMFPDRFGWICLQAASSRRVE